MNPEKRTFKSSVADVVVSWHDKEVISKLGDEFNKAALKAARMIEMRAKNSGKWIDRTGNLRKAIKASASKYKTGGAIVYIKYGPGGGNHFHLLEYGTVKMAPRPFMRPAIIQTAPYFETMLKSRIRRIIG